MKRLAGIAVMFLGFWGMGTALDNRQFWHDLPLNLGFPLLMVTMVVLALGIICGIGTLLTGGNDEEVTE